MVSRFSKKLLSAFIVIIYLQSWSTVISTDVRDATRCNGPKGNVKPNKMVKMTFQRLDKIVQKIEEEPVSKGNVPLAPKGFAEERSAFNDKTLMQTPVARQFGDHTAVTAGWRYASIQEFPYLVSIMYGTMFFRLCSGILVTPSIVLTYVRCVSRRKLISGKAVFRISEVESLFVVAGTDSIAPESPHMFIREVLDIITEAEEKSILVCLSVLGIPYTVFHRPIKIYSSESSKARREKIQDLVKGKFCEVPSWDDIVICRGSAVIRPQRLKVYKVKIQDPTVCEQEKLKLGIRSIGEWPMYDSRDSSSCFLGGGGSRCGSVPGSPIVCGNVIYGMMSTGTSCSEFGDVTHFIPLNDTNIEFLLEEFKRKRDTATIINLSIFCYFSPLFIYFFGKFE